MPTMNKHNLERRLHRHSIDTRLENVATEERRHVGRHSFTGNGNKENFGVHFLSSSCGNTSLIALQDLSNGKSPQRRSAGDSNVTRTPAQAIGRRQLLDLVSDTSLSLKHFNCSISEDSQLSSARMGDTTLDRMLDAIIESAHKEVPSANTAKDTIAQFEVNANTDTEAEVSIHEMEVRTPTHLKRQRVVRRKNPKRKAAATYTVRKTSAKNANNQSESIAQSPFILPSYMSITGESTPANNNSSSNSCSNSSSSSSSSSSNSNNDINNCRNSNSNSNRNSKLLESVPSTKRCLSFSSSGSDLDDDNYYSVPAKRSSVASSTSSGSMASTISSSSSLQLHSAKDAYVKGSLDLAIFLDQQKQLNVHVIRCRDLQRSNGSTAINAYVKVALKSSSVKSLSAEHGFQRTAVHRHSSRPFFDHRFKFDITTNCVTEARLQLAVWHRDRHLKRSEFLGCVSFPLQSLDGQPINGSYKLQSQACLHKPQEAILVQSQNQIHQATATITQNSEKQQEHQHTHRMATTLTQQRAASNAPLNANTNTNVNTDEAISIDNMAQEGSGSGVIGTVCHEGQPMVLSKKALHQRDADENLFLRFLELDPIADSNANTTTTIGTTSTSNPTNANHSNATAGSNSVSGGQYSRRLSSITGRPIGRTPFTMTKRLARTEERGFGFSIVWTHPPRVEKVEAGLSADRCGILPGDYVIFVDKHNVVTMPEADILNLIRSQGSTLTLEIFRRPGSGIQQYNNSGAPNGGGSVCPNASASISATPIGKTANVFNGKLMTISRVTSAASDDFHSSTTATTHAVNASGLGMAVGGGTSGVLLRRTSAAPGQNASRPNTACSGTSSAEAAKRRLHLPQVTFSKESIMPIMDNRRRFLLQLISREQNFTSALHFGIQRFVQPLLERKDLISPNDHRTLFQNVDELLRISEDILEQLCNDDQEPHMNFASRVYLSKTTAICAAYKKYCNGIKRADCVLVNKSRQTGSEFIAFITEPQVPRKRPDLTMFIHRPLQHFREILKLMQLLASNCHVDTEEHRNFSSVISELQAAYREITVNSGLMEPLGEGRPLLTLQDLESRMVFTKCKPFTLAVQGRQWIFGGDLSRVEGRSIKPYWTLLFSDIIVFAKVSRDRVLFITEEPIPIANIVDSCFHMRKKTTEFRLTVDPSGRLAESPTGYCAPDLTRTPKKSLRRKSLVLRAPSLELKAVWQNLLQRQIFLVNAALGSTPLSSPLDSPDVLNTLVPLSDIGIASASMGSMKIPSLDSINLKNQQQQNDRYHSNPVEQIELLIDEKCRILNKTGTPKSSALHLANWMKGQLDKQQEQARLAAIQRSQENISTEDENLLFTDSDQDERITYWTHQQLEKRTKELNLSKENGTLIVHTNFGGKRLSGVEELSMSDVYSEDVPSQLSQSHSTTSDSQITVRSSPIGLDKLAVCRHCHKNCQQQQQHQQQHREQKSPSSVATLHASPTATAVITTTTTTTATTATTNAAVTGTSTAAICGSQTQNQPVLVYNSLKVQHSQSSPNHCCKLNGSAGSVTSISSSTITGEQFSELSSKVVASSSRRGETVDTESDVAQLITDELSQSEATDESVGAIPNSTGSSTGIAEEFYSRQTRNITNIKEFTNNVTKNITDNISKLRILDSKQIIEQCKQDVEFLTTTTLESQQLLTYSYCSTDSSGADGGVSGNGGETDVTSDGVISSESAIQGHRSLKPEPLPRKVHMMPPIILESPCKVEGLVTIAENAQLELKLHKEEEKSAVKPPTKSEKSSIKKSPSKQQAATPVKAKSKFIACPCRCTPADFANSTLSPDELEQQTCKLIDAPQQTSPKLEQIKRQEQRQQQQQQPVMTQKSHENCKCICGVVSETIKAGAATDEEEDLSLMLIGLAQFAPTAKLFKMHEVPAATVATPTTLHAGGRLLNAEAGYLPTIAVVPPTPEAVLTKTTTNVWDNNSCNISINTTTTTAATCIPNNVTNTTITTTATKLHINNVPHQAIIENIPEDSCDESPLDEEPPYRPMINTLRRFGTMSSLEKLPSDDRLDNADILEDDLDDSGEAEIDDDDGADDGDDDDDDNDNGDTDADDDDNALVDNLNNERHTVKCQSSYMIAVGATANGEVNSGAWTSRAGSFVSGKMSFLEESRAFIDKYLGRWHQDQEQHQQQQQQQQQLIKQGTISETDEQLDECTSGATSGEEVWGTPTSGGENDDMHLVNSENTQSSPTKSSTSLNEDDDTELMMDELLMAPPMTASTIRGLLPRRRLEPLFEEETESDEEKTQQENEEIKKGETTTNGHCLKDLDGNSNNDVDLEREVTGQKVTDEQMNLTKDRFRGNLQMRALMDPQSIRQSMRILPTTVISEQMEQIILKASSCEYLLEQRSVAASQVSHICNSEPIGPIEIKCKNVHLSKEELVQLPELPPKEKDEQRPISTDTALINKITTTMATIAISTTTTTTTVMKTQMMPMSSTMTTTGTTGTTMTTTTIMTTTTTMTTTETLKKKASAQSPVRSLTTTTISSVSDTTNSECNSSSVVSKNTSKLWPAKFIPPPPPPRRLLLTQTNLQTTREMPPGGNAVLITKTYEPQQRSGFIADNGSSVDVGDDIHGMHKVAIGLKSKKVLENAKKKPAAYNILTSVSNTKFDKPSIQASALKPRTSSTIIETSLLGPGPAVAQPEKNSISISSQTVSTTTEAMTKTKQANNCVTGNLSEAAITDSDLAPTPRSPHAGSGLSPRLEMRLALNHDILGDEDLICYDPGPDLTTILGHDLSTFQRLTGRDLLSRSATNRVQPKEAVISFSQQRNSKMDTPTVNRRPRPLPIIGRTTATEVQQQHSNSSSSSNTSLCGGVGSARVAGGLQRLQPNPNTWSNSAFVAPSDVANVSGVASNINCNCNRDESKLGDLEILARREKIYCMSQLKSGSQAKRMEKTTTTMMTKPGYSSQSKTQQTAATAVAAPLTRTTSTTSMGVVIATESMHLDASKTNRLINFIKRRNSEISSNSPNCSNSSLNENLHRQAQQQAQLSPRKDNDKPSLNRRLWKQITKRRRANSMSEIVAG